MNIRTIGGVRLFRPRPEAQLLARREAEVHLRAAYSPGSYTDGNKINEIIQYQFQHFDSVLHSEVLKSASMRLMEFLLAQYDASAAIEDSFKKGALRPDDSSYWPKHGPVIRRALKYLAEIITSLAPTETPQLPRSALLSNLETIVISAEKLVELYMLSDQTHGLPREKATLTIYPQGRELYWEVEVEGFDDRHRDLSHRIRMDLKRRRTCITGKEPGLDMDYQGSALDADFEAEFGFTYRQAVQVLWHLIDTDVVPDRKSFDVPFVRRDLVVHGFHEDLGWPKDSVARVLDGFSIGKASLQEEGRTIFKPKQEYRAFRRAFFEMPHETGSHLMWSRRMARECWLLLIDGSVFQRFPPEWRSPRVQQRARAATAECGQVV